MTKRRRIVLGEGYAGIDISQGGHRRSVRLYTSAGGWTPVSMRVPNYFDFRTKYRLILEPVTPKRKAKK